MFRWLKNSNNNWRKEGLLDKDMTLMEEFGDRVITINFMNLFSPSVKLKIGSSRQLGFSCSMAELCPHSTS